MIVPIQTRSTTNFGNLTHISRGLNRNLFGDNSGRTISLRSAHGFKSAHNLPEMHEDRAEDIIHGIMILAAVSVGYLSVNKSKDSRNVGYFIGFLILILVFYYSCGKRQHKYSY